MGDAVVYEAVAVHDFADYMQGCADVLNEEWARSASARFAVSCGILLQLGYDTRCYFNLSSKADMSQLNLPHGKSERTVRVKYFKPMTEETVSVN